jgi:ribosomal protein S21
MAQVFAKDGKENLDSLLRRFRRKVLEERIINNCRERSYFMKPSERRRREEQEKKKRIRKANSRRESEFIRDIQSS